MNEHTVLQTPQPSTSAARHARAPLQPPLLVMTPVIMRLTPRVACKRGWMGEVWFLCHFPSLTAGMVVLWCRKLHQQKQVMQSRPSSKVGERGRGAGLNTYVCACVCSSAQLTIILLPTAEMGCIPLTKRIMAFHLPAGIARAASAAAGSPCKSAGDQYMFDGDGLYGEYSSHQQYWDSKVMTR